MPKHLFALTLVIAAVIASVSLEAEQPAQKTPAAQFSEHLIREESGGQQGAWTMHVLKEKWTNANQVIAADPNQDKRIDLIATAERGANELRWWRNTLPDTPQR
jgi:hypothetical protein